MAVASIELERKQKRMKKEDVGPRHLSLLPVPRSQADHHQQQGALARVLQGQQRASLRGGATVGRIPLPAIKNDTAIPAKDLEPVGSIVDEQQLTPLPETRPMTPPPPSIFSTL